MILHTFNKPDAVVENLRFVAHQDKIVLFEDGVYALLQKTELDNFDKLHVIQTDIEARGLTGQIGTHCKMISYNDLVTMCVEADRIMNWF